ncbi:SDR family oxidoreductase [Maridesulfovibrio sp.]|uniref:SDR family oxidoreductase n=1 Tax=Maridesulfovibrio sp. TaxID=2795000 RepID=UPI002A18CA1E|nr:SDR family oxidoreductase [Maridesulfovibrio sp.]
MVTDYNRLFDVTDKVVAIAGATGILGAVFCKALAQAGAIVAVGGRNCEKTGKLVAEIDEQYPGRAKAFNLDVSSEDSVKSWGKDLYEEFGKVDALINNAAFKSKKYFASLEEYDLADWQAVVDVNMTAIFLTVREIGSRMARDGKGTIINISSIYGIAGPDQRIYEGSWYEDVGGAINTPLVYSATKGAVVSMTKYLATYWGDKGVRTNTVTPGGVSSGQNEEFMKNYGNRVPLGRMAESHEIVGAIMYLVSDASSYVNGTNLVVDGGWTAW